MDVIKINAKGTKLIKTKKSNFLSFKFNLNFIFFIKKRQRIKKGIKIPTCLRINNIGFLK